MQACMKHEASCTVVLFCVAVLAISDLATALLTSLHDNATAVSATSTQLLS
jgi:hypothetical protein